MPGEAPPPADGCHGNSLPATTESGVSSVQEMSDPEGFPDPAEAPPPFHSLPLLEANAGDGQEVQLDSGWSQDGGLAQCGRLDRKWLLWHEFMKEHAHLDAWLRLAEQAVSSSNSAHLTYVAAKEELRKFERLRCEAASRLVQLDSLTQRNRTLTRLFEGAVRARLLAAARESGACWDDVNARLETNTHRLKLFVSEWEEFEAEREELVLWLADLDIRLNEVEHLTGSTCHKMRRLQAFQQCVCVQSGRVNAVLRRGEELMQCSEPPDAQDIEMKLKQLLQRCSSVYNRITHTHTHLLSMRLVFEDDCILSQAPDSGCPSETLLEDEGALDKPVLVLPAAPKPTQEHHHYLSQSANHPPPPPSPPPPTHEHQGLEWDPSVDIGGSVSHDDADSSYFSANTGLYYRDGLKRRSYLSSLGSLSDITNDITNQEADLQWEQWLDPAHPDVFSPITMREGGTQRSRDQWAASTPDGQDCEPVSFDGGRVKAWLRVQSSAPLEGRTSCSRAVQTDWCYHAIDAAYQRPPSLLGNQHRRDDAQQSCHSSSPSCDLKAFDSDWTRGQRQSHVPSREERSCCDDAGVPTPHAEQRSRALSSRLPPALLYLLLAVALALLACLVWSLLEPPCHRSNRMPWTLHLALRYVNGPPPT